MRFTSKVLGDTRTELERLNVTNLLIAFREAEHVNGQIKKAREAKK